MCRTPARRWRAGAVVWALSGLLLPLQVLVARQWPDGYSITANAISDLGVTHCGVFADAGATPRPVCSPWYPVFNAGLIACGALTTLGAILLHGRWGGRAGSAGMILMALSGLFVVLAGATPWNVFPDLHDVAALCQAVLQWLAMILLATGAGPGRFRVVTLATVLVSVVAFGTFIVALGGAALPVLSLGIAERLAFDTLTLWTAGTGIAFLITVRPRVRWGPTSSTPSPLV